VRRFGMGERWGFTEMGSMEWVSGEWHRIDAEEEEEIDICCVCTPKTFSLHIVRILRHNLTK